MMPTRSRNIYSKQAALSRTPMILRSTPILSRTTTTMARPFGINKTLYRAASLSKPSRPTVTTVTRPDISTVTRPTARLGRSAPSSLQRSILPVAGASGAGGLTGGGLTGGLSTSLGTIGTDISSTFGGITEQAKGFVPTAVKIIAAVVVLKIVLWLVRGRRR